MTKEEFITHVRTEQNALRGFLLALCCGNKDEADDILQDSLVKAYLALGHYSDSGKFHSWIFKIAFNTFLSHNAAMHRHAPLEEAETIGVSQDDFEHQPLYLALSTLASSGKKRCHFVLSERLFHKGNSSDFGLQRRCCEETIIQRKGKT